MCWTLVALPELKPYILLRQYNISMGWIFPLHLNLYKAADVGKLIEDQNFKIVETEKIFQEITAAFIVARRL
jgi:hypothetical protein